ncbi:MAG: ABC transporter permease, partial [Clostridia bacterium]
MFKQTHILNSVLDVKNLIRNTGISCIVAYALSFNLPSGRLDFSLGAQRVVGTIIGGNFALYLGLSGVWVLLFSIVFGIIFGFITGYVFVLTRINPMVLGIGMGLIFECIAFVSTKGVGLDLFGVPGVSILTNELFTMGTIAVTALIVLLVTGYTRFGYNLRAIQGSQAIAQGAGINVFKNAVVCYTFSGGLVCVAGTLDAALNNQMESTMGFSSQGPVMTHFFSMQLGGYLAKWSNMPIGIIVASLTLRIFTTLLIRFELD